MIREADFAPPLRKPVKENYELSQLIYDDWIGRWQRTIEAVGKVALIDDCRLEIKPAASLADVKIVEDELGFNLPEAFKKVVTKFSAGVDFFWFLRDFTFPPPFDFIFHGDCSWDLHGLLALEKDRSSWLNYSDGEDSPYEIIREKMLFLNVGNGDRIAIDLNKNTNGRVIYIACHFDDEDGHGYVLGENFVDFIDRWTRIGCVGAEISQMISFTNGPTSYLQPEDAFAIEWRKTLGI